LHLSAQHFVCMYWPWNNPEIRVRHCYHALTFRTDGWMHNLQGQASLIISFALWR
jgi:hypothetical protein